MDYDGTFLASESRPFKFASSPGLPRLEPPRRKPCRSAAFALVSPMAESIARYLVLSEGLRPAQRSRPNVMAAISRMRASIPDFLETHITAPAAFARRSMSPSTQAEYRIT